MVRKHSARPLACVTIGLPSRMKGFNGFLSLNQSFYTDVLVEFLEPNKTVVFFANTIVRRFFTIIAHRVGPASLSLVSCASGHACLWGLFVRLRQQLFQDGMQTFIILMLPWVSTFPQASGNIVRLHEILSAIAPLVPWAPWVTRCCLHFRVEFPAAVPLGNPVARGVT